MPARAAIQKRHPPPRCWRARRPGAAATEPRIKSLGKGSSTCIKTDPIATVGPRHAQSPADVGMGRGPRPARYPRPAHHIRPPAGGVRGRYAPPRGCVGGASVGGGSPQGTSAPTPLSAWGCPTPTHRRGVHRRRGRPSSLASTTVHLAVRPGCRARQDIHRSAHSRVNSSRRRFNDSPCLFPPRSPRGLTHRTCPSFPVPFSLHCVSLRPVAPPCSTTPPSCLSRRPSSAPSS